MRARVRALVCVHQHLCFASSIEDVSRLHVEMFVVLYVFVPVHGRVVKEHGPCN